MALMEKKGIKQHILTFSKRIPLSSCFMRSFQFETEPELFICGVVLRGGVCFVWLVCLFVGFCGFLFGGGWLFVVFCLFYWCKNPQPSERKRKVFFWSR